MSEFAFPVFGAAFVLVLVLPLFALLAKLGLILLERDEAGGPLHGFTMRYLLLTGSSALPMAWLVSAGLHQSEARGSVLACLFEHASGTCFEPGIFAATLAIGAVVCSARVLFARGRMPVSITPRAYALMDRLEALVADQPSLARLAGRLRVTEEPDFAVETQGLVRPWIVVGARYAEALSADALSGALGHEAEHLRAFDPLRYLVLELALAVNPVGRSLLAPHAFRWLAAREAHCDREAVIQGLPPLALAEAMLRAAKPRSSPAAALGARDTKLLRLRVGLLFAFAEQTPSRCCHRGVVAFPTVILLVGLALFLPHETGTGALDALHAGAERALLYVWR